MVVDEWLDAINHTTGHLVYLVKYEQGSLALGHVASDPVLDHDDNDKQEDK